MRFESYLPVWYFPETPLPHVHTFVRYINILQRIQPWALLAPLLTSLIHCHCSSRVSFHRETWRQLKCKKKEERSVSKQPCYRHHWQQGCCQTPTSWHARRHPQRCAGPWGDEQVEGGSRMILSSHLGVQAPPSFWVQMITLLSWLQDASVCLPGPKLEIKRY